MAYHRWSISFIAGKLLHGWEQRIRVEAHGWALIGRYVNARPERGAPPSFWHAYSNAQAWARNRDASGIPNAAFVGIWLYCCNRMLARWVEEVGEDALDTAKDKIRSWVGYAAHGFSTFQGWLNDVWYRVGSGSLWFASNLIEGVGWVAGKLPAAIRNGWKGWEDFWREIKDHVKDWARRRFDEAKQWASTALNWVTGVGQAISTWYNNVRSWVSHFMNDPYGSITRWLGGSWDKLYTFARDCLVYWYNLWGRYAPVLAEFLGDPLGFVYDRVEDELVRRW